VIGLGAGWLAILVVALGDRALAIRLVWPAAIGAALVVFGRVLTFRGAALGEVFTVVGVAAGVAALPLALAHGVRRREAMVLGGLVLPVATFGVAALGGEMLLPVGVVAVLLAGLGSWIGGTGWLAVGALGLAALGGAVGHPVAGALGGAALGIGEAGRLVWPLLPRGAGLVVAGPAMLPVVAAAPGWAVAVVIAGFALVCGSGRR
jgi:hypothetical protein